MENIAVQEMSLEAFSAYGTFAQMTDPKAHNLGASPIDFYPDLVQVDLGQATKVSLSTCRVSQRPNVVDVSEFHTSCGEGLVALDGDVLIHVAPVTGDATPPVEAIEVFRVPQSMAVSIRPGVWHHAPFALDTDCANVLILLPERIYANDCTVVELAPERQRAID